MTSTAYTNQFGEISRLRRYRRVIRPKPGYCVDRYRITITISRGESKRKSAGKM